MTSASRARYAAQLAGLLAAMVVLAGCTSGGPAPGDGSTAPHPSTGTTTPAVSYPRYVALGDSYTSAPLVPHTDVAKGCFRSDHNYPTLLATRLHVEHLADRSCAGATIENLTRSQHPRVPPQLRALTRGTDLVTLGIGGNEFGTFERMVNLCAAMRPDARTHSCGGTLGRSGQREVLSHLPAIGRRLGEALDRIHHRAPSARVLVIGYPQMVPAHGTCARLPIAATDYPLVHRIVRSLNRTIRRAARSHRAEYIDVAGPSAGHDICSRHPWVNGHDTDRARALAYHPFEVEQRAVARLIEKQLTH